MSSLGNLRLFWASLTSLLVSASIACYLIARIFVNLPMFTKEPCQRMSLRHCQTEHLGWMSQSQGTRRGCEDCACFQGNWALTFMMRMLNSFGSGSIIWSSVCLYICEFTNPPGQRACGDPVSLALYPHSNTHSYYSRHMNQLVSYLIYLLWCMWNSGQFLQWYW